MPFIDKLRNYRSLSIVGLEKNTGKTVCLNYILGRLHQLGISTAVTSIGVDGEQVDSVYATAKPEITLYEGMQFITSHKHYLQRRLVSEILSVDERRTALGQLVTGQVLRPGRIILSGAATTGLLKQQLAQFRSSDVQLAIVDGALSRLSLASPTVTEAMILATGAAVSPNLQQLISRTRFVFRLINLPEAPETLRQQLSLAENGLWIVGSDMSVHDLGIQSVFMLGPVSTLPNIKDFILIVRDFTKLFITPDAYADFTRRGGTMQVLQRSHLVAVCLNPTSPQGYTLNSDEACRQLSDALQCPVYDVKRCDQPE